MSEQTISILRWACSCGRFVAAEDICERNYRDPDEWYGIGVETHYHCSRCGFRDDMPHMVEIGTEVISA